MRLILKNAGAPDQFMIHSYYVCVSTRHSRNQHISVYTASILGY